MEQRSNAYNKGTYNYLQSLKSSNENLLSGRNENTLTSHDQLVNGEDKRLNSRNETQDFSKEIAMEQYPLGEQNEPEVSHISAREHFKVADDELDTTIMRGRYIPQPVFGRISQQQTEIPQVSPSTARMLQQSAIPSPLITQSPCVRSNVARDTLNFINSQHSGNGPLVIPSMKDLPQDTNRFIKSKLEFEESFEKQKRISSLRAEEIINKKQKLKALTLPRPSLESRNQPLTNRTYIFDQNQRKLDSNRFVPNFGKKSSIMTGISEIDYIGDQAHLFDSYHSAQASNQFIQTQHELQGLSSDLAKTRNLNHPDRPSALNFSNQFSQVTFNYSNSQLSLQMKRNSQPGDKKPVVLCEFDSPLLKETAESAAARKTQLPDIIKMSVANLDQLSSMNPRSKRQFLTNFKESMQLNPDYEQKYLRAVSGGRKKSVPFNHKADRSLNVYQSGRHLRSLEPMNVAKKRYIKQFGTSTYSKQESFVDMLKQQGSNFN